MYPVVGWGDNYVIFEFLCVSQDLSSLRDIKKVLFFEFFDSIQKNPSQLKISISLHTASYHW